MKLICSTALLSQACQNVQRAVSAKSSFQLLEGILIKALGNEVILTGYDNKMGINTSVNADIDEPGAIVLNARLLCDILRRIPFETVKIECDERNITVISSGDIRYSIMGLSADDYPDLPEVNSGFPVVISQKLLRNMVRQTIFSVAPDDIKDESKAVYTGIKFELSQNEIKLVAIDGNRMALRKEAIDYNGEKMSFVVPAKTLAEVVKLAVSDDDEDYVSMGIGKSYILFEIGDYTVISRLLEDKFVSYQEAIPITSSTTVKVKTRSFIESVERTSLIITDKIKKSVRCVFDDGFINVSSVTPLGTANDRIQADIKGSMVEIGLNNRYLLEALKASETDEVKIELNGSFLPILISPTQGDSFTFLVGAVLLKKYSDII